MLSKLHFFATNFIDDLCCLLLSYLGIHLPYLYAKRYPLGQLISSILIVGKIIYAIAKFIIDYDQKTAIPEFLKESKNTGKNTILNKSLALQIN